MDVGEEAIRMVVRSARSPSPPPLQGELLLKMPRVMGEMRAVVCTLLVPITLSFDEAEKAMLLLRATCGAMWGMAASLRASGKMMPATPGQIFLFVRLLRLSDETQVRKNGTGKRA